MISAVCACLLLLAFLHRSESEPQVTRKQRRAWRRDRLKFNPHLKGIK